jgi:predicted nucleotidyltransferase
MRINTFEKDTIVQAVCQAAPDAKIWLFGSRTDDSKKGGDIDIAILSDSTIDVKKEITIKQQIFDKIGEQKIDLIISTDGQQAFFKFAIAKGILLHG